MRQITIPSMPLFNVSSMFETHETDERDVGKTVKTTGWGFACFGVDFHSRYETISTSKSFREALLCWDKKLIEIKKPFDIKPEDYSDTGDCLDLFSFYKKHKPTTFFASEFLCVITQLFPKQTYVESKGPFLLSETDFYPEYNIFFVNGPNQSKYAITFYHNPYQGRWFFDSTLIEQGDKKVSNEMFSPDKGFRVFSRKIRA